MGQDERDSGPEFQVALLRELAQAVPEIVSCCDRQRRIVYINRTMSRDASELIGRPIEDFIDPQHRELVISVVEDAFSSGQAREMEYALVLSSGALRHIHTRVLPFRGPNGDEFALALTQDVSERKRLVEQLEHSIEFRRRVVEHLPDFVVLLDREHRFVWANRVAPGLTFADIIGKRVEEISPFDPNRERVLRAAFEERTVGQYETEAYGDGKSTAWYLVRVVPIVVDGKVDHVLGITSDITERKRAEQALRKTEEQLHQAQRLES